MKFILTVIIVIIANANLIYAQTYILTGEIGKFYSASSFSINTSGFIFIADSQTNEITKLDTLGKVIHFIGGYGWSQAEFDNPVYLYANSLNVYVCDKNNNRIQIFDKDLNFLSEFKSSSLNPQDYVFAFPTCVATSSQGDFYILDSDNNRIIKYDLNGNFRLSIGSYDSGSFILTNPKRFSIDSKNNIWVIDNSNLVQFDQFGNGISKNELSFEPENISIYTDMMFINSHKEVYAKSINTVDDTFKKIKFITPVDSEIIATAFMNSKLYILTTKKILIYTQSK
ncbi:NHL repeat-containing protein [Melioribacteraceae bacterium 4301-Me]|uniref:NHL repeat-containing protein n=1 Tax=Pyranulibacter aquaticus TaxID=3163344 RepID=UPI003597E24C